VGLWNATDHGTGVVPSVSFLPGDREIRSPFFRQFAYELLSMNYRRNDSPDDRRSVPRFGEEIVTDRRRLQQRENEEREMESRNTPPVAPSGRSPSSLNTDPAAPIDIRELTELIKRELLNELGTQFQPASSARQASPVTEDAADPAGGGDQFDSGNYTAQSGDLNEQRASQASAKRRPGRPSSLPSPAESNDWPRKTYRFHKERLRQLKHYQNNLDETVELSVLIDQALELFLKEKGFES